MRRCALFTLWILTIAVPSYAAPHAAPQLPALLPVECDRLIELLLATTAPDDRRRVAEALVDMTSHTQCLADAMMQRAAFPSFLRLLETLRTDKQSGASAGTGGSTNLVSKGTTAKILSVAAEYGALTETVNKQLVTVQGSADAIPATLIRHNLVRYCPTRGTPDCASSTLIQTLQRFSYAVSFDTGASAQIVSGTPSTSAGGTALPAIFSADRPFGHGGRGARRPGERTGQGVAELSGSVERESAEIAGCTQRGRAAPAPVGRRIPHPRDRRSGLRALAGRNGSAAPGRAQGPDPEGVGRAAPGARGIAAPASSGSSGEGGRRGGGVPRLQVRRGRRRSLRCRNPWRRFSTSTIVRSTSR